MSIRNWTFRIRHILEAIARILEYTGGMNEETFRNDQRTVDAVIRNFLVVGEAAGQVPVEVRSKYPQVPWVLMQGMRHVLVHNYDMVRLDIVWRSVQEDLPPLIAPLAQILSENP